MVAAGAVHGWRSDRWGIDQKVLDAAARLDRLKQTLGEWSSREVEIPQSQIELAGAIGHLSRVYTNAETGQEVHVMLLCGRHGPISVHPPTVCFTSAGWKQQKAARRESIETAQFFVVGFGKQTETGPRRLRTYWAWSTDGRWEASDRPRLAFAGSPYLYKLYVSCEPPIRDDSPEQEEDASRAFMRVLLPELEKLLK